LIGRCALIEFDAAGDAQANAAVKPHVLGCCRRGGEPLRDSNISANEPILIEYNAVVVYQRDVDITLHLGITNERPERVREKDGKLFYYFGPVNAIFFVSRVLMAG